MKDSALTPRDESSDEGQNVAARHTPGPWGWYFEDYSMAILCGQNTRGQLDPLEHHVVDLTICPACKDHSKEDGPHWKWGRCYTAKEADARLIAAAPELLEACHAVLNMVEGDGMPPDWDFIRAAVAKATQPPATRGKAQ